jgi:hypothetical protein
MVYDGKPSKGCGSCRARKIRCDQTRPTCWECTRTNRECPGYRDELSLMFRDQTELVTRKARSTTSSSAASTSSSSARQLPSRSGRSAFLIQSSTSSVTTNSSVSLNNPVFDYKSDPDHECHAHQARQQSPLGTHPSNGVSKQEAICFFLQSHAIAGNFLITDTLTNFLMESGGSLGQQAIQSSIVAVASALLSRVRGAAVLMQAARQEYGSALKLVNRALADANESKTNQTLAAVVLLALYEVSTCLQSRLIHLLIPVDRYIESSTRHRGLDKPYLWSCSPLTTSWGYTMAKRNRSPPFPTSEVSNRA